MITILLQLRWTDLSQRPYSWQRRAQQPYAFFAFSSSRIIFAASMLVFYHRVANYQVNFRWHFYKLKLQRTAVQQQSVPAESVARNKLIHDSASRTYKFILGALA